MKQIKNCLLTLALAIGHAAIAQVGINTTSPEATLDIRGTNHLGAVTALDGILVPRVNALAVAGATDGQLVYLIADAGSFLQGFHYWDGAAWASVANVIKGDSTNDSWENLPGSGKIQLSYASDGSTARAAGTEFAILDNGLTGIGTSNPQGILDLSNISSSIVLPRLTDAQRDAMPASNKQASTLLYNSSLNRIQTNSGTDVAPSWFSINFPTAATLNTSAIWKKTNTQIVDVLADITFLDSPVFDNTLAGYITKDAGNSSWTLAAGKKYEVKYDSGGLIQGTTTGNYICSLYVNGASLDYTGSVSPPANFSGYISGMSTGLAIINATATTTVSLKCSSQSGTKTISSTVISFKVLN